MALESGFFNSINGDRLYNARDMSRYFENILTSGIFKRITDCFKVSATGSMACTVAPGAGLIDCQWFRAATAETVTIPTANAVLPRFDVVVARLDLSDEVRAITLMVVSGDPAEQPSVPEPVRTANMHDLVLALVYVPAGATAITPENLTDVRENEWYCGYVHSLVDTPVLKTFHARYEAQANNVSTVPIGILGFNRGADLLNVYINGFRMAPDREYTISGDSSTITLTEAVDRGTVIDFEAHRPIMMDEIPDLGETVTDMAQQITTLTSELNTAQATITAQTAEIDAAERRLNMVESQLADLEPISAGDFVFDEYVNVSGYASSTSERIYFSIPFNRPILATTIAVKKMIVAARQSGSYILGGASATEDIASSLVSVRKANNGMLSFVFQPTFKVAPFNNAEVSFYIDAGTTITFT